MRQELRQRGVSGQLSFVLLCAFPLEMGVRLRAWEARAKAFLRSVIGEGAVLAENREL
jgi:hypothetical protein